MQFQADISNRILRRPANAETTALGAAYLAGLTTGFWEDTEELKSLRAADDVFASRMPSARRHELIDSWHEAVSRTCTR